MTLQFTIKIILSLVCKSYACQNCVQKGYTLGLYKRKCKQVDSFSACLSNLSKQIQS